MTMICEASKAVAFVPCASEAECYKIMRDVCSRWRSRAQNMFNDKIFVMVRSDNGESFRSERWKEVCRSLGLEPFYSPPWTPQQNGTIERAHKDLMKCVRAMLHGVPVQLWSWAVRYYAMIRNHTVNKSVKKKELEHLTPNECLEIRAGRTTRKEVLKDVDTTKREFCERFVNRARRFGSTAWLYLPEQRSLGSDRDKVTNRKLGRRAVKGVYLGRAEDSNVSIIGHFAFREDGQEVL